MDFFVIIVVSFFASLLTFFSGFGLGTLLTPVFLFFFPLDIAVALTAGVHLLNNIFKAFLVGKRAETAIVIRFGIPALAGAYVGARMLLTFSDASPILSYVLAEKTFSITPLKLSIGILMIIFALFEIVPSLNRISFSKKWLSFGGLVSGFFGGLSGHQGALRSAFLLKFALSKEAFIATGVLIAVIVDLTRISVYLPNIASIRDQRSLFVFSAAVFSALLGAFIGRKFLHKTTIHTIQWIVSILIFIIAIGLIFGLL